MSIESVIPSNHLILCCTLLLLPSNFPSNRVFSNELALCIRWPKYWSFSFSISPSNEYSGLISSRIDWCDLLAVQETLKSLLQHHNWRRQFFGSQPSLWSKPPSIHGWLEKIIALTIWNFVGKMMSLLFNMLSRFVVAFLPRSKCLNFMAAVTVHSDFGAQENKICHCFYFFSFVFAMKWWDQMPWS